MKRYLAVFLTFVLFLTMIPVAAADEPVYSGSWGENITWAYAPDSKTFTVSGSGGIDDYDGTWPQEASILGWYTYWLPKSLLYTYDFAREIEVIVMEEGVTAICPYAFYGLSNLQQAILPDSMTVIGDGAFEGCGQFEIQLPQSVTTIQSYAFAGCDLPSDFLLDTNVTTIGAKAFSSSFSSVRFPTNIMTIDVDAFYPKYNSETGCLEKQDVYISDLTNWCRCSFLAGWEGDAIPEIYGCGNPLYDGTLYINEEPLVDLIIPEGITIVEEGSFSKCSSLRSAVIPEGITQINAAAFMNCRNLSDVSLPDTLTTISDCAFRGCESIESIVIPDSVETLGDSAFADCSNLRQAVVGNGVTSIYGNRGASYFFVFDHCWNLEDVTLGSSVEEIKRDSFMYCSLLTSMVILNPSCAIEYDKNTLGVPGQTVIYGYKDSTAEYYAKAFAYTFVPIEEPHVHSYTETVTPPTCTEQGYTTHTCECGDSYIDSYIPALGHDFKNGVCIRCGEVAKDNNPFTDVVAGKYYYDAVVWAYFHDPQITSGTGDTTFSPNATCTRAQIVTFLWRAAGSPEPATTNNPFDDVGNDKYYYKAVLWAAEEGITTGTGDRTFSPNSGCTRAQVVTFLWRFAGSPEPITTNNPFSDVPPAKYYTKAVLWASEHEITAGTSETTFSPGMTCTRGQIVTFLYRYMGD